MVILIGHQLNHSINKTASASDTIQDELNDSATNIKNYANNLNKIYYTLLL